MASGEAAAFLHRLKVRSVQEERGDIWSAWLIVVIKTRQIGKAHRFVGALGVHSILSLINAWRNGAKKLKHSISRLNGVLDIKGQLLPHLFEVVKHLNTRLPTHVRNSLGGPHGWTGRCTNKFKWLLMRFQCSWRESVLVTNLTATL